MKTNSGPKSCLLQEEDKNLEEKLSPLNTRDTILF
jgi:hypothetical protein